ncbi:MAG: lysophospholipid acyltransferase family protein [Bacillota bacterium]
MITAKHHPLYVRFSDWIMKKLLNRHFRCIHIESKLKDQTESRLKDQGGPVLLIANHFSWWDGFLARYAVTKTLKKKVFVMMLEEELSKHPFLRKVGAFSIRRNSRSASQSIQYARQILQKPDHLLLIFPQGKFQSSHQYPLDFEEGWFRILQGAPENTRVVFLAALTDYFTYRRPGLYIHMDDGCRYSSAGLSSGNAGTDSGKSDIEPGNATGCYESGGFKSPKEVESAYNLFLKKAIQHQNQQANQ